MKITKEHLDKPIFEVEPNAANTQTYREFIRESEFEFGLKQEDIDSFDDEKLNEYLEFMDYLWTK
jgi:hypothetical protein